MLNFQEALTIVNKEIQAIEYPEAPSGLYAPISYILALKGKKIRPAITLLACNLYKDNIDEAINPALAWEIFHNFTLMHDDVMDKAELRRGQVTVHKKWNENTAILSGDVMLILAYQYMLKSAPAYRNPLLHLFSQTAAMICEGQQFDMEFENCQEISPEKYINMIRLKTAVMLGACLKTGGIIAGACENDLQNLYDFGINLGIAFQIKDDYLDVYGNPDVFGKTTGGDILCNKKTFLSVQALNSEEENVRKNMLLWMSNNDISEKKIEAVRNLYDSAAIGEKADRAINRYYEKAVSALQSVSVSEEKKSVLYDLAQNLMNRDN
jgi:geranylgeranyl diphosphate synthase type II